MELGAALESDLLMATHRSPSPKPSASFRSTLIRVVVVQAVALTLLGLLQFVYNVG